MEREKRAFKRPNEGDLIFFPLEGALFEIKFVEGKKPFYQLRNLYVYELLCERFEFEDEIIDVAQVDAEGSTVNETVSQFGNILTLNLVGTAATTAVASVSGIVTDTTYKSLQYVDLIHDGAYVTAPTVKIQKPFFGIGVTATKLQFLMLMVVLKLLILPIQEHNISVLQQLQFLQHHQFQMSMYSTIPST